MWDDFGAHFSPGVVTVAEELVKSLKNPTNVHVDMPTGRRRLDEAAESRIAIQHLQDKIGLHRDGLLKLRRPDRIYVVELVNQAWEGLSKKVIINGFSKCQVIECNVSVNPHDDVNEIEAMQPREEENQE
ncbi:hypothetical protein LEN26_006420 [Aphanomyces euteiches]|nr:hypothetical protein LEN26_006420 [Aphanomyces euteiches]